MRARKHFAAFFEQYRNKTFTGTQNVTHLENPSFEKTNRADTREHLELRIAKNFFNKKKTKQH